LGLGGSDYYPFGMIMPGRKFTSATQYRYGFNGKEEDDEVKGDGNSLDFGARIYDSRLGRWYSLDPLQKKYPDETNYGFVSNNPLIFSDVDGRDKIYTLTVITKDGNVLVQKWTHKDVFFYSQASGKGFGNDKFYKRDIFVNVIINQQNSTGSSSQDLGVRTEIPRAFYYWSKITSTKGDMFGSEMCTQKSGITFTSSFTLEVNGPKTFAKMPTGEVYNVDALMAMAAYTKSGEALELKLDDLADWINHVKDTKESLEQLTQEKEKNESPATSLVEPKNNSSRNETSNTGNNFDTIKPGTIYYNRTLQSKLHKNKNGTSTLYYGERKATPTGASVSLVPSTIIA
jgi:RHS repeat-associated protein